MACACQTAPLRAFLRSFGQLSLAETSRTALLPSSSSSSSAARSWRTQRKAPLLAHNTGRSNPWAIRGFHDSRPRLAAAAEAQVDARDTFCAHLAEEGRPEYVVEARASDTPPDAELTDSATAESERATPRRRARSPRTKTEGATATAKKPTAKTRRPMQKTSTATKEETAGEGGEHTPQTQREHWQAQKQALREKFPEGWNPRKKLSPDALEGIRALNRQYPETYTTAVLAARFEVSPEAMRRILKGRWQPSAEEEERRQQRWFNRGKAVWSRWAELGRRPPRRWREEGILRDYSWTGARRRARERESGAGGTGSRWADADEELAVRTQSLGKRRRVLAQRELAKNLV